jgi:hypothetical protein
MRGSLKTKALATVNANHRVITLRPGRKLRLNGHLGWCAILFVLAFAENAGHGSPISNSKGNPQGHPPDTR